MEHPMVRAISLYFISSNSFNTNTVRCSCDNNPSAQSIAFRSSARSSHSVGLSATTGICRATPPAFHPGFLRKIQRLTLVPHHAERAGINFIAMPRHQFFKSVHIASLGGSYELSVTGGGLDFFRHRHCP